MTRMSGGYALVEALRAEGVTCVFGLIGSATMELFDGLYDASDIRFVGVRDERTGVHMADGYARVSGKAGVFIAGQNGPGATNLVTGLAQARAAYSPVVSLAGSLSSAHVYRDAFQEVDQQALFTPITKKTWTLTQADRIPEMTREAFRTALSPRRGPVHLNLPRDLLATQIDVPDQARGGQYRNDSRPFADPRLVAQAAEMLAGAERPLILIGGGIKATRQAPAVLALAEALNAPVATAPGHGDAIPFDHPLNAGQAGPRGNPVASGMLRDADVILALGTRLGFNTTFYTYDNLSPSARIIHVELEPTAVARYFPVELPVWADAANFAGQLTAALNGRPARSNDWTRKFKDNRAAWLEQRDAGGQDASVPIKPQTLFRMLRDVAPRDTIYTMDAGTLCLQATDALNYFEAPSLLTPLDFGLVGFSFACGLGARAAEPGRPIISLMGDGGFGMTMTELATAVGSGLNTVTVVMNNGCWGAEKAYQRDFFDGRYIGADVVNPPYDKVAELYGGKGFRVERPGDFGDALKEALTCGRPAVIDVQMDPNALYSFRRDSFKHREKA